MGKKRGHSDIGASCLSVQRLLKGNEQMKGSKQETYTQALASQGLVPLGPACCCLRIHQGTYLHRPALKLLGVLS